jgi:hypothetical protein
METSAKRLLTALLLPVLLLYAMPACAELIFTVVSQRAESSPATEQEQASTLFPLEGGESSFSGIARAFANATDGSGIRIDPEETATAQTNWTVVLRVDGEGEEDEGKKSFLKASASLTGLLTVDRTQGPSDGGSASVAASYFVDGKTVLFHAPDPLVNGGAPIVYETPVSATGAKDLGQVKEGDTITLSGNLIATAHAHRGAIQLGNTEASATAKFDDSMAFSVALVPVPEPQTYVLMLAGLTLIVFVARRRSR